MQQFYSFITWRFVFELYDDARTCQRQMLTA